MNTQPEIDVGIIAGEILKFKLGTDFRYEGLILPMGSYSAIIKNSRIHIMKGGDTIVQSETLMLIPAVKGELSFFELSNVTIGIDFHWEQKETQRFRGVLKLIVEEGKIRAINRIGVEEYLKSVISSEMSAAASDEFLKAHAVISRSWLMSQLNRKDFRNTNGGSQYAMKVADDEVIRWYDREDHENFDVCADDHCQRYQGITKIASEKALLAVSETTGLILIDEDLVCDARFSKCCGGVTEHFENVWEPVYHPYLTAIIDADHNIVKGLNLQNEKDAHSWIYASPNAFCNEANIHVLRQVLPDFDQATIDFFRWEKVFTQEELAALIKKKSGIDFGFVISLDPVLRGSSGRIIKLRINGTKKVLTLGKELEIRKWLSDSHLYSSAFIVEYEHYEDNIPQIIKLKGAGWGHGVGLCQIGAAVMGEKGYSFRQILLHYFQGAELQQIYSD